MFWMRYPPKKVRMTLSTESLRRHDKNSFQKLIFKGYFLKKIVNSITNAREKNLIGSLIR